MPRVRLGVALMVPEPQAHQIDGLRRAFGDPALDRIGPHVTLVPPVNVRTGAVASVLHLLRAAAARARTIDLTIGPPRTFPTDEHVVYLEVGGPDAGRDQLSGLRAGVMVAPLDRRPARPADRPFVPHVTLTTGVDGHRVAVLLDAAAGYTGVEVSFDRIHLLQQEAERPHRWHPVADVRLGPAIVVGRGGLGLELTPGELVDPEAGSWLAGRGATRPGLPSGAHALVVTARRGDPTGSAQVVGVAQGWTAGPVAEMSTVEVDDATDGTDDHLHAAWWSAAAGRSAS